MEKEAKKRNASNAGTLSAGEIAELRKKIEELEKQKAGNKRIEEALLESEERFKILFEYAPDAYYLNDTRGRFVEGNRAAEELIGYSREELIGKSFLREKILAGDQIKKAASLLMKGILGRPTGPDELVLIRKDGTKVVVEIRTFPVRIRKKKYVLGIARDITERKRAEESLRESERRYRALFEQANDAIFHIDLNGFHIAANKKAADMLGYSVEELKSLSIEGTVAPSELAKAQQKFNDMLSGKSFSPYERIFRKKDGTEFPVEINVARICDIDGRPLFIQSIVRDITERKRAEEFLNKSREELRKLNAYLHSVQEEERALFANEMHDEIGQGLTALKMDLMRLRKNLPSEDEKYSSIVTSMEEVTAQLIQAVRRMYTEMRPSVLDELGLVPSLEWQLEEFQKRTGIDCAFRSDTDNFTLNRDLLTAVFRISQELLNKIAWEGKATRVRMIVKKRGDGFGLEITDNGAAADEVDDDHSLALSGIKERVEYLGGAIEFKRNKGKDVSVSIRIPLNAASLKSSEAQSG